MPALAGATSAPSGAHDASGTGESIYKLRAELADVLNTHLGIVVTDAGLTAADDTLASIAARYEQVAIHDGSPVYNTEWQAYVELGNMILCAHATVTAARNRKESRGAFQSADHPDALPEARHSLVLVSQ